MPRGNTITASTDYLDTLPQCSTSHDVERSALRAFENAIGQEDFFIIQGKDEHDYGTDVQLEARIDKSMTNERIHVQLKGTNGALNSDGSVSISVDRKNLNYLLRRPFSQYVCYHVPSKSLFHKSAEDVHRQYEKKSLDWHSLETITIRFEHLFDSSVQQQLHALLTASGKSERDQRLQWSLASPGQIPKLIDTAIPMVELSGNFLQDYEILQALYHNSRDEIISASFDKFEAALSQTPRAMLLAYMAEINLGINGYQLNEERVRKAVRLIEEEKKIDNASLGELNYCIANGYMALGEHELAVQHYQQAIGDLANTHVLAMCHKNLGAAYKVLGEDARERSSYEKALELVPELSEAKFALAICRYNEGEFQKALSQLDSIVWNVDILSRSLSVQAWRVAIFFNINDHGAAFREIYALLGHADRFEWILPWCAKHVWQFGMSSMETVPKALDFWKRYLQKFPDDMRGCRAQLLCLWRLHESAQNVDMNFGNFKQAILKMIDSGDPDPAFLWDRIGHWAQTDGLWEEAEAAYRKAFELDPEEEYGYCLGVVLNHFGKYAEALPILLSQAERYQPDERSWLHVAQAYEGIGDANACTDAYGKAIKINPDFAQAWFDFGGSLLNLGHKDYALDVWEEAVSRFPEHEMIEVLEQFFEGRGPVFGGIMSSAL